MAEQIHPAERLLNLVIALLHTPGRMTKEQVRASVAGYGDASSDEAFERMFERDKDTLRELGVPVLTVTGSTHGDDVGYRIDRAAYALPPIQLSPAELGVVCVAAQFWQDRAARTDATRGLTKLRAVGTAPEEGDLLAGLAPQVQAGGAAFTPLLDAIQGRRVVRFTYRAASTGEVLDREVEPWRLLARSGGWVLVGRDRRRAAARSFRLARIEGSVSTVGGPWAFPAPDPDEVDRAVRSWDSESLRTAVLAVLPERAEALRARAATVSDGPAGRDLVEVAYTSTRQLAAELVGYGEAVLVVGPDRLRDQVLTMLDRAARLDDAHG